VAGGDDGRKQRLDGQRNDVAPFCLGWLCGESAVCVASSVLLQHWPQHQVDEYHDDREDRQHHQGRA
jgi:hypothetical protein